MFRALIGLLAGVLLAGAIFAGPLSPLPMRAEPDDTGTSLTAGGDDATSASETIAAVLDGAGSGITDADTAAYYQKLVDSYRLVDGDQRDETAASKALPDIDNITRQAITLPLQEVGKMIRDEEIARFYQGFLESTGLTDATD